MSNITDLVVTFTGAGGKKTSLYFDAILSETHDSDITVTKNAVEAGVVLSDHIYIEPRTLKATVVVSDAKVIDLVAEYDSGNVRSIAAFEKLVAAQRLRTFMTVQTSLVLYKNMVIEKISVTRDPATARIMKADIDFLEVITASVQTVKYQPQSVGRVNTKSVNVLTPASPKNGKAVQ